MVRPSPLEETPCRKEATEKRADKPWSSSRCLLQREVMSCQTTMWAGMMSWAVSDWWMAVAERADGQSRRRIGNPDIASFTQTRDGTAALASQQRIEENLRYRPLIATVLSPSSLSLFLSRSTFLQSSKPEQLWDSNILCLPQ